MPSRSPTATSPLRDLALHIDRNSLAVAHECLRFRYEESPDLLALMASKGEMDYRAVLEMVHDVVDGRISVPVARAAFDPYALSSLACLMAGLGVPTGDFADAAIISRAVRMIRGSVRLGRYALRIDGQANIAVGQFDSVKELLDGELDPDTRWILRAEYEHPAHGRPGATHETWLDAFNQVFHDQDLLPIRISDGPGAPFDRLAVDVPDSLVVDDPDAPLVTVIMSTFKPDQSFPTAVASLVAQTWRNLEILVVDDCSPPAFDELLESVAATDPRIRLFRMPENGGTYRIRNFAIAQSRGSFIAFQDSDDWAHPERIARQVAPLLDQTGLVATSARALRVHDDMTSLRVGSNSFRRGEASLMFRKDVVIDAMDGFDEVRKSADTEFLERLILVFGEDAFLYIFPVVLVLTQLTEGSLSRDELKFGWHHGARRVYVESRRFWHREIAAGRGQPRLEPGEPRRIPVPVPSRILTGRDPGPLTCDILVVSDWRDELVRYEGVSSLIDALAGAGYSTVVAQATAARHSHRHRAQIGDDILRLEADGITQFTVWTDPCHAHLLLVTDPEILALTRPPDTVGITADRVVVAAGHPSAAPEGGWMTYDPVSAERNAKRMFGADVAWLPANESIADDLQAAGATSEILPPHQLRIAPAAQPRPYTGLRGGTRLIVGTTGLGRDRPSWASLRRLLPRDDDYDVRLRADPDVVKAVLKNRPVPPGWLVMDETTPMRGFLRQLDVFVAVPSRSWGPDLPWSVITALAEGAVVVIDPAYQPHLRGAAVYASAIDIHDELKVLAADPDRVAEYRERGYAFCREVLSAEATVRVVRDLAGHGEDD